MQDYAMSIDELEKSPATTSSPTYPMNLKNGGIIILV